MLLGFAFTGYLLPWDQRGYWATKVGTEIAASAPVIGEWQVRLIRGGPELGQATLTRFYVVHILLLPGALIMLIGLHLHQLRHHGMAPPITRRGKALLGKFVPFFPHWVVVDASLGLGLLLGLIYLSWSRPAPLEFPADPSSTDFLPRPEWYFLFLFQLLKYFPGPLEPVAAFLIPLLVVGSIMLLPFLDRSEERRPWRKPIATTIGLFYAVSITGLTMIACQADRSGAPVEEVIVVQPQLEATSTLEAAATIAAKVEATEAELAAEVNPPQEVQPPELEAEVEGEDQEGLAAENAPPVQEEQAEALAVPAATEDLEPGISPAAQAPLSSQPNVLIAIEVSQAILDSQASYWAEAPRLEVITKVPEGNHPLWAAQNTNTRSGADTWRCKECHGWDYLGAEGAYGSGSHFTGFPGIYQARTKSTDEIVAVLSGGMNPDHDFSPYMDDAALNNLAVFIQELDDYRQFVDYSANTPIGGNAANGKVLFEAEDGCQQCHGLDGAKLNFGTAEEPELIGTLAVDNPQEFIHKAIYGQPGSDPRMVAAIERGWSINDLVDILAHAQTLPTGLGSEPMAMAPEAAPVSLPQSGGAPVDVSLMLIIGGTVSLGAGLLTRRKSR